MSGAQSEIATSPAYWTHGIGKPNGPVAKNRIAQYADHDSRLNGTDRMVLRFISDWQHNIYGDALASLRFIENTMRARAPAGRVPTFQTIGKSIITLIESGWLIRTYTAEARSKDASGSRYVVCPDILDMAAQGRFPEKTVASNATVLEKPSRLMATVEAETVATVATKNHLHEPVTTEPVTCGGIESIPPGIATTAAAATPGGAGCGVLVGFDRVAAAYDKKGDNLVKACAVFNAIAPDKKTLERMVAQAASWKRTARGPRMALARWLEERRWESKTEKTASNDNAPSRGSRYPSCMVTNIKAFRHDECGESYLDGCKLWYLDTNGERRAATFDEGEFEDFKNACGADKPFLTHRDLCDFSEDLHEFKGVRFKLNEYGFPDDADAEGA